MDSKTDSKLGHLGAQWIAEIIGDVKKRRDDMQKHLALLKNEGHYKQAHVDALALLNAMLSAAAPQVVADDMDMQTIRERDRNAEMADKLADGIAEHFGVDIGEHSSANCPWAQALDLLNTKSEFINCAGSQHAAVTAIDQVVADEPAMINGRFYYTAEQMRAALAAAPVQAQEPVACKTCGGAGIVSDGEINAYPDGTPYMNGPVKCVKDCPDCAKPVAPVQPVAVPDGAILKRLVRYDALAVMDAGHEWGVEMESADDGRFVEFDDVVALFAAPAAQGDAKDEAYEFAARVIELFDDATMRHDHMLDAGECATVIRALKSTEIAAIAAKAAS